LDDSEEEGSLRVVGRPVPILTSEFPALRGVGSEVGVSKEGNDAERVSEHDANYVESDSGHFFRKVEAMGG
jgi:hypothetical protein